MERKRGRIAAALIPAATISIPVLKTKEAAEKKIGIINTAQILNLFAADFNALLKALEIYSNPGSASMADLVGEAARPICFSP